MATSNAIELSTVGVSVKYAIEASAGTRPTSGYTLIPNVTVAPAFSLAPQTLDASDLGDDVTQYIAGRRDPGGDAVFTANLTSDLKTLWATLCSNAATAKAAGKRVWFEYATPDFDSYYWSGDPVALGHGGFEQNAVQTVELHVVPNGDPVWASASA